MTERDGEREGKKANVRVRKVVRNESGYISVCLKLKVLYIYIYIERERDTVSSTNRPGLFYQNFSVWLDRLDSRSWDRNQVIYMYYS